MKTTFNVADLHGRADLLYHAIAAIEAHSPQGGTVVFTGDYVDRGPQSMECVARLMQGPADPSKWTWVCLKGNHEEFMYMAYDMPALVQQWLRVGGKETLISYGQPIGAPWDVNIIPQAHIEWMRKLPTIYRDGHRVFVHAGMQDGVALGEQRPDFNMWHRYKDDDEGLPWADHNGVEYHVVHGHTPVAYGPVLLPGRSNFDTMAFRTGRLVVGLWNSDAPGGPVGTIEIVL